jgi:hypothetical protein
MELTINIKEAAKQAFIIKLLQEFEYVEIIDVKEDDEDDGGIDVAHKELLEKRLERIAKGESTFKSWDIIKKKYEKKVI